MKVYDSTCDYGGIVLPFEQIENVWIYDTPFDDVLDASGFTRGSVSISSFNGGSDILRGGSGNDYISAGYGYATMSGGDGNDTFSITSGAIAELSGGSGFDRLAVQNATVTLGSNGQQTIQGIESIDLGSWYNIGRGFYQSLTLDPQWVPGASDFPNDLIVTGVSGAGSEIIKD